MTGSGDGKNHTKSGKSAQSGSREARLAAALRENLRRRKTQERVRGEQDEAETADKGPAGDATKR